MEKAFCSILPGVTGSLRPLLLQVDNVDCNSLDSHNHDNQR